MEMYLYMSLAVPPRVMVYCLIGLSNIHKGLHSEVFLYDTQLLIQSVNIYKMFFFSLPYNIYTYVLIQHLNL